MTSCFQKCLLNMETMERQYDSFVQHVGYGTGQDLDPQRRLVELHQKCEETKSELARCEKNQLQRKQYLNEKFSNNKRSAYCQ